MSKSRNDRINQILKSSFLDAYTRQIDLYIHRKDFLHLVHDHVCNFIYLPDEDMAKAFKFKSNIKKQCDEVREAHYRDNRWTHKVFLHYWTPIFREQSLTKYPVEEDIQYKTSSPKRAYGTSGMYLSHQVQTQRAAYDYRNTLSDLDLNNFFEDLG